MKLTKILLATSIMAATTTATFAFDRATVRAMQACHDYLWNDVPEFKTLPKAAISVFPGSSDKNGYVINWNVKWDKPRVAAGGNCDVRDGIVAGFEQYGKNRDTHRDTRKNTSRIYFPEKGIICDKENGFCADREGVSLTYTKEELGQEAQDKLMRIRNLITSTFTLSNGVYCDTNVGKCFKSKWNKRVARLYTRKLF